MRFTAKYGHLESIPDLKVNEIIKNGEKIGRMGNTGKSTGAHLHFDLIAGLNGTLWRLAHIHPSIHHAKQSAYFIDDELFKSKIEITTFYCDPRYKDTDGKLILHPGYDVIPKSKNKKDFDIFWNRSMPGQVLGKGNDAGYGNYILIGFDC